MPWLLLPQGCATWKWIGADVNPSPERKRGVATPALAAGPRQPLAYARGSDSRLSYARILSIGLHLGKSSTFKSHLTSAGPQAVSERRITGSRGSFEIGR